MGLAWPVHLGPGAVWSAPSQTVPNGFTLPISWTTAHRRPSAIMCVLGQARGHCSYGQGLSSGSPARFFLFWPHLNLENSWLQRTDLWPCFKGGRNMAEEAAAFLLASLGW